MVLWCWLSVVDECLLFVVCCRCSSLLLCLCVWLFAFRSVL